MKIEALNACVDTEARELFLDCCHCRRWAADMTTGRPYQSLDDLLTQASVRWESASEAEILEAFSGHARIGDLSALRAKYQNAGADPDAGADASRPGGHTEREQGQVAAADEATLQALRQANLAYEEQFGFIFIVCATGKSAAEMLSLLQERLPNSRNEELVNGAAEQGRITALRLRQKFGQPEQDA